MTNLHDAIDKLLRRINRASSKGKEKKVDRLTNQLDQLLKIQEFLIQESDSESDYETGSDFDYSYFDSESDYDFDSSSDSENPVLNSEEREDVQYEDVQYEDDE